MSQSRGAIINEKQAFGMVVLILFDTYVRVDILVLRYAPFLTFSGAAFSRLRDLPKCWTENHLSAGAKGQRCHFVARFSKLWVELNNRVFLYLQP